MTNLEGESGYIPAPEYFEAVMRKADQLAREVGAGVGIASFSDGETALAEFQRLAKSEKSEGMTIHFIDANGQTTDNTESAVAVFSYREGSPSANVHFSERFNQPKE